MVALTFAAIRRLRRAGKRRLYAWVASLRVLGSSPGGDLRADPERRRRSAALAALRAEVEVYEMVAFRSRIALALALSFALREGVRLGIVAGYL